MECAQTAVNTHYLQTARINQLISLLLIILDLSCGGDQLISKSQYDTPDHEAAVTIKKKKDYLSRNLLAITDSQY